MNINNPCSITELKVYCRTVPFTDDNEYINNINVETKKFNEVDKRTIAAVFKLAKHYSIIDYTDVGCAIISFMAQPDDLSHNVYINIVSGQIGIVGEMIPDKYKVEDLCNNIKQILLQTHSGI